MGEAKKRAQERARLRAHLDADTAASGQRPEMVKRLCLELDEVLFEREDPATADELLSALGAMIIGVLLKQGAAGPAMFAEWHAAFPEAVMQVVAIVAKEHMEDHGN